MAVLKALAGRGEEGLEELWFTDFAEEAESCATDVLICVEEIVPDAIAT